MISKDTTTSTATQTSPVKVSLPDLKSPNPIPEDTLLAAFGPSSLGILIVSDLSPQYNILRTRVLQRISRLAHLPSTQLDELVNEKAKYLVGWSHGKETLQEGVTDFMKGSYYVNANSAEDEVIQRMRKENPGFDEYLAPNVWPVETGELEGFKEDVENLVNLIVDVARYVARSIDRFAEQHVENWPNSGTKTETGYLEGIVSSSRTSKARLLHYFPAEDKDTKSWCTIHKDHGCLTGLTSAAFFDESSSPYDELEKSPSTNAGLYILDREENVHKVGIPRDCLAFQTGEALEKVTKGKLKAVPHYVNGVDAGEDGVRGKKIARNTLAVFTQPNLDELVDLDQGITFGEFARGIVNKNTT